LKASLVQERGICVKLCRHVVLAARGQSHKWLCTIWLQLLSRLALWRSATQSYLQCLHIWHNLAQRHNGESHKKEPVVADMPFGTPEYDQPTGTHDPQWRAQCRIPLGAEINIIYRYQMQMGCTNRFSQTILTQLLPTCRAPITGCKQRPQGHWRPSPTGGGPGIVHTVAQDHHRMHRPGAF
jgi:hypothetical protein